MRNDKRATGNEQRAPMMAEHAPQIRKRYKVSISPGTLVILVVVLMALAILALIQVNEFQRGLRLQSLEEDHEHKATEPAGPKKNAPHEEPPEKPPTPAAKAEARTIPRETPEEWLRRTIPQETLEKWAGMLESHEVDTRTQGALKLREYSVGYPYLARALNSPYEPTRRAAANALAFTNYAQALPRLEQLAESDPSELCREVSVYAVGKLGGTSSVEVLARVAQTDSNMWVRRAATHALGDIVAEAAKAPLLDALRDTDDVVRESAARGLLRLVQKHLDPEIGDALLKALDDVNPGVRRDAARSLGILHRADAQQALVRLVDHTTEPDWGVRAAAAQALGQIFEKRGREVPQAMTALKKAKVLDPEPVVTFFADRALRAMGYAPGRV